MNTLDRITAGVIDLYFPALQEVENTGPKVTTTDQIIKLFEVSPLPPKGWFNIKSQGYVEHVQELRPLWVKLVFNV